MKERNGFVSNSSTSSFICQVCGREELGMDGPGDFGMLYCENEHLFCEEEKVKPPKQKQTDMFPDIASKVPEKDEDDDDRYEVAEKYCPICSFTLFSDSDLAQLLQKMHGVTREEVFAEVKKANKRRKKLYDSEYNMFVSQKHEVDLAQLLKDTKAKYANYKEFRNFLRSK